MNINTSQSQLRRRTILRGLGVGLALPMLDAMRPAIASPQSSTTPRRLIAIQTNQGILPKSFFPEGAGDSYKPSPYLQVLERFRDRITALSGVSHPHVDGGHAAEQWFLDRGAASGNGRVSQHDLRRPIRRRADRALDAVPLADAFDRHPSEPILHPSRGADSR